MKKKLIPMIICLLIAASCIARAGTSLFVVRHTNDPDTVEAVFEQSGNIYRPYIEVTFDMVTCSSMYLYTNDENSPTDWLMCGFVGDRWIPFFITNFSGSSEMPADEYDVTYILQYPSDENSTQIDWAYSALIEDLTTTFDVTEEEVDGIFSPAVMQAARNSRTVTQIVFGVSAVLSIVFFALIIAGNRRDSQEDELSSGYTGENSAKAVTGEDDAGNCDPSDGYQQQKYNSKDDPWDI